jgi:agmatine deiminase
MTRCNFLISLTILFLGLGQSAGLAEWDVDHLEVLVPHAEGQLEKDLFQSDWNLTTRLDLRDNAPGGPIRNCAEWEPATGVMIRYPLGLPYNLLRDLDDNVILHVVVSSGYQGSAQSNLEANGVNMEKVQFLVQDNNSIWTRDYGPWFVFNGDQDLGIVNHTYNRPWRPDDNLIPHYFGLQQGLPVYSHSMYHAGGNYMTDGAHISSSTQLVYLEASSENGMSQSDVDDLMAEYYGIENYSVLDYIESGGIHHIDTWAKFLDEETVLVKEVWPTHHTYAALEQRATLLASLTASTGRPYQVHRIYCYPISGGSPASYTNSLILNNHIYVPFFGNSTYDQAALDSYREAAPGYEVSGYYYNGFLSDDALHCRTKGIMDSGMLRVEHVPVIENRVGPVLIGAKIVAHSGQEITQAELHFRHGEGPWESRILTPLGNQLFQAEIPGPDADGLCEYYLAVQDGSGRSAGMPRSQPESAYIFSHQPDLSDTPGQGALDRVRLGENYPNPFNPSTTFRFSLAQNGHAELSVLDTRGRIVRRLLNAEMNSGDHEIHWDGIDDLGRTIPSGVYLYRLRSAGLQYTRTMTLVK